MQTALDWRNWVRLLLRDTGRETSSGRQFFDDAEIIDAGTVAREKLIHVLRNRPPEPALLTLCRSLKSVTAISGRPIPDDLFFLECGIRSSSDPTNDPAGYIPVRNVALGEQMQGMDGIYADGAVFYGTAELALYYAKPSVALDVDGNVLTDYSESFYDALATMVAIALVVKKAESYFKTYTQEGQIKIQRLNLLLVQQIRTLA